MAVIHKLRKTNKRKSKKNKKSKTRKNMRGGAWYSHQPVNSDPDFGFPGKKYTVKNGEMSYLNPPKNKPGKPGKQVPPNININNNEFFEQYPKNQ